MKILQISKRFNGRRVARLLLLIVFVFFLVNAKAAVQPADRAVLNYTQVMFEFDEQEGADLYQLSVYRPGDISKRKIAVHSLAYLVKDGFSFGESYQWYYTASRNGKVIFKSNIFSFSIATDFLVDDSKFRYSVLLKKDRAYQDNLIFIDYLGVAINRSGQPVWYMPFDSSRYLKAPQYRNMQMTAQGSFTFLKADQCYEKDRQGNVLWGAPNDGAVSGDATEQYHHDFEKRPDGSYMACSYQYENVPGYFDSTANCRVRYNTVIQYNAGKVAWQWNEKDHVSKEALFSLSGPGVTDIAGTHMNGFSFDDKKKTAVFSFRNNNTLLWVNRQNGEVLHRLAGVDSVKKDIQFTGQHSPVLLDNGDLLVYNNNAAAGKSSLPQFPKILLLGMPAGNKPPQKKWEYECTMNEHPEGWAGKEGYAGMLPNGNVLVCIGGGNKIFEVTRSKKIVWEMNCTMLSDEKNGWMPFSNYRSHFASSLYPYYYTVQKISAGKLVKAGQVLRIKINNDGTEADTYKVDMFSGDIFNAFQTSVACLPGSGSTINIPLVRNRNAASTVSGNNFVLVRISSVNNAAAVKNIEYGIIK
jgi:Arylsulfotransferase (ASST)